MVFEYGICVLHVLLVFMLCTYYWHSRLVLEFGILIYYLNLAFEFDIPI